MQANTSKKNTAMLSKDAKAESAIKKTTRRGSRLKKKGCGRGPKVNACKYSLANMVG